MATSGQAKMGIITGWIYYPEFLFSKKSKFLHKSGHINRLDILSVDILSGVYCIDLLCICWVSSNLKKNPSLLNINVKKVLGCRK